MAKGRKTQAGITILSLIASTLSTYAVEWSSYNDCAWTANSSWTPTANDPMGNYSTNSPIARLTGSLVDSGTGSAIPSVQVSFVGSATSTLLDRNMGPPAGTDANTWFAGKVGTNCAANWSAGNVLLTFTNLDPSGRYNLVIWSTRGADGAVYSNRFTDITISGVDVFTNRSSTGTEWFTSSVANDRTRIRSALAPGQVVRYDGINPGSDGGMTFTMTAGGDLLWPSAGTSTNGYLNAFVLEKLIGTNAGGGGIGTAVYWPGTEAPSGGENAWRFRSYDASTWTVAPAPYWYGDNAGGTQLTNMQNSFCSLYTRIPFVITNAAAVQNVTLTIDFDDAFVAWIDGTQVAASSNAPVIPTFSSLASPDHESSVGIGGTAPEVRVLSGATLVTGTNYICIQGFNVSTGSSDFVMNPTLQVNYQSGGSSAGGNGGLVEKLPPGANWRYLDVGGFYTGWQMIHVWDIWWYEAPTPLGYASAGDAANGMIRSRMNYGPMSTNRYLAYFFRRNFALTNTSSLGTVTLHATVDDGAIFYVNSNEVYRYNMPSSGTLAAGANSMTYTASTPIAAPTNLTISVPGSAFVDGSNVVTVEVHQSDAQSTDLYFDLWATNLLGPDTSLPSLAGASSYVVMPGSWFQTYYGTNNSTNAAELANMDTDGDGLSGWQEYMAGTDPMNPASDFHITSLALTGGLNRVYWLGGTNGALSPYHVEYKSNLTQSGWITIATPSRTAGTNYADISTTGPAGFYRINTE